LLVWASGKDRAPVQGSMSQGIRREVFLEISGTSVDDLLNNPNYPNSPSFTETVTDLFEAPVDEGDNYGQRMHGLLKAPATGNYTFWISSDDNGQLLLSNNETAGSAQVIASVPEWTNSREWSKFNSQKSAQIYLEKDNYYYIAALMKEETGGDNLAIGWELPDGTRERPMSASHIYNYAGELHTNFSISSSGEPLILTDKLGETIHYIPEVAVPTDISYGLKNEESGFWYFSEPTPGEPNNSQAYSEILDSDIEFSHTEGFYTSDFSLTLTSSDPAVKIYYTLDGSDPSPDNLDGSGYFYKNHYPSGQMLTNQTKTFLYDGPINIKNRTSDSNKLGLINPNFNSNPPTFSSNYFKGTVVRAIAVKDGALTNHSSTKTYFVTAHGRNRYNLPVMSIASDEKGLFDYYEGIYVPGKVADEYTGKYDGGSPANYNRRGVNWERPAHIEFFNKDVNEAYNHSVGIRIHGGWSRANPRKSIRIYSRSRYGTGDRLEYPFFEDHRARGNQDHLIMNYKRILLRNSGNDFDHTLYRDALMTELVKDGPFSIMAHRPVIHFINGEYWGIMNLRERFDKYYFADHYSIPHEEVVILDAWGGVVEGNSDDRKQFFDIVDFAEKNNMKLASNYLWVKNRVDVESLAGYYAAQIYFFNEDWPHNNQKFWKYREGSTSNNAPRGLDGRWGWLLYDTDFGMGLWNDGKVSGNRLSHVLNPSDGNDPSSRLFRALLTNDEFKSLYVNIAMDQINSSFKSRHITRTVDQFNAQISSSRTEHYNRWKNGSDLGGSIKRFGNSRPGYVMSHMEKAFDLSGSVNVVISREGKGCVKVNSITIDENLPGAASAPYPWTGVYYKDVPITLSAVDVPGYRFSHWTGVSSLIKDDRDIKITPTEAISVKAVFTKATSKPIHYWHFNDLPKGELGQVDADISTQSVTGFLYYSGVSDGYMDRVKEGTELNALEGDVAGNALRVRNPSNNRYLDFEISTKNYEDIKISYAVTRTSKGSEKQRISYKTSSTGSWTLLKNILITEQYQLIDLDLSDKKNVSDNEDFMLRIGFTGDGAKNDSGNNRFDNIIVSGFSIVTSVDSQEINVGISVYPNPVTDYVNIVSESRILRVEISGINGQMLIKSKSDDFYDKINVSDLQNGLYILNIVTESGSIQKKLLIE